MLSESVNLARDVAKVNIIKINPATTNNNSNSKGKSKEVTKDGTKKETTTDHNERPQPPIGPFPRRVYLHCSVGDILDGPALARENELDAVQPTRSTGPELRGFDRLRNAGFTEQDVNQLRRQFSSLHGGGVGAGGSGVGAGGAGGGMGGDDDLGIGAPGGIPSAVREEELTQLEEQWINTGVADAGINVGEGATGGTNGDTGGGGGGEVGTITLGDDYLEELVGLLVGMFLGILALLVLKEPGLFSRRQKHSILAGIAINCSFALVRMFN